MVIVVEMIVVVNEMVQVITVEMIVVVTELVPVVTVEIDLRRE